MGQALYRKYRSTSFDDVVGQTHVTKTLQNALLSGRVSHAYLFTGPRGVGKTSVARILAHAVNKLEYNGESAHLDIIEIDAASNRRIDEIRDLRDKVNISPAVAKYKVYIIDEVHMLTREAFNALLKTLEEPPAHCIFILATTEAHKLPDTIVSRTQRFEFKAVNSIQGAERLAEIAKQEKIEIDKAALQLLATHGEGSFRDSIGYLDQLSAYSKRITADDVRSLMGLPAVEELTSLLKRIKQADMAAALQQLKIMQNQGIRPNAVAAELSGLIRDEIATHPSETQFINLLVNLLEVSASHRPQEKLEIVILSAIASYYTTTESPPELQPTLTTKPPDNKPINRSFIPENLNKPSQHEELSSLPSSSELNLNTWAEIVSRCKHEAASVYTALRLAVPQFQAGRLILSFQFPLHQKKLEQAKNKQIIQRLIEERCGQNLEIKIKLDEHPRLKADAKPEAVTNITSIFGSAEVIEV